MMLLPMLPISIPNLLTILRIILTPLFLIFLIDGAFARALLVFVVAGISDVLDGFIARFYYKETHLGAHLDPIADKLLLITAFATLAVMKMLPAWLAVLVISRDILIILGYAVFFVCQLRFKPRPTLISKVNTHVQFYAVLLVLSRNYIEEISPLSIYLFYMAAITTISSGLHYIYLGYKIGHGTKT